MPQPRFTPQPPIYTFRVRILGCGMGYAPENSTEIQREIEIASNHTLGDLGFAILKAYNFDDDHLFSFFLSGKAWDKKTEYAFHGYGDPFDAFDDIAAQLPEGSEMRKLAELADDPNLPLDAPIPPEIDQVKLRAEMADLFRASIPDAPAEDRAVLEELMQLVATTPQFDSSMMSDALRQYLASGTLGEPGPMLVPGLDLGELPILDDFDEDDEDDAPDVDEILIREIPYPGKTGKKEFLFLYDYGDEWEFGVKLLGTSEKKTPRARYPRVTAKRGKAPDQYPAWDDDDDWGDEDEDADDIPHATIFRRDPLTGEMIPESIILLKPPEKPTDA
jgi:hypothetical protein